MHMPRPVMNAPAQALRTTHQAKVLSNNFQSFQNPHQARFSTLVPRGFFDNIFGGGDDEDEDEGNYYGPKKWKKGDKCDFAAGPNYWIEAEVTDVSDQGVMVNARPGKWISTRETTMKLRKRFKTKGYAVNKGKDLDLPDRKTEKSKAAMEKFRELTGFTNRKW